MDTFALIHARLSGDAALAADLSFYDAAPAIFSERGPDGFMFEGPTAAVIIAAPTGNEPDDTLTEFGREVRQDVRLYANDTGSSALLDRAAERVRSLFHARHADLSITGGKVVGSRVTGPVAAPTTDPSLIGRRLTLQLTLEEN